MKRSLSDFRGQFVVLEWQEKGCPDVAKHYRTGHMPRLPNKWMDRGVAGLLLTSSAEGFHSDLTSFFTAPTTCVTASWTVSTIWSSCASVVTSGGAMQMQSIATRV